MSPQLGSHGLEVAPSQAVFGRGGSLNLDEQHTETLAAIQRGDSVDPIQMVQALQAQFEAINRGVTSSMTAFPVRENLEAEVVVLVPQETPLRNRLPRKPGAGTSVAWKQASSLGGGWGTSTDQPGGVANSQSFFSETGAPAPVTTVYANRSSSYKLMGLMGSVTGFAMAAGANFQNQLATEKANSVKNLMLVEEYMLINGDATSTAAPFGDGTNALAFNGIINLVATGNGTPSGQIQTSVGALTFAHLDAQLVRAWKQGATGQYLLVNSQEALSIKNIALGSGSIHRVVLTDQGNAVASASVQGYTHPITGQVIPILVSRFVPAGTIIFGADAGPEGRPALEVNVLPQVQLPESSFGTSIQGYTAQEIAPTAAAPQVFNFLTSVYETLAIKNATVFAKSTGVTAV